MNSDWELEYEKIKHIQKKKATTNDYGICGGGSGTLNLTTADVLYHAEMHLKNAHPLIIISSCSACIPFVMAWGSVFLKKNMIEAFELACVCVKFLNNI